VFKVHTGQGSSQSHSVVEAFEVLEVPAKSSSSFPNGFIGPACQQAGIRYGSLKSTSSGFRLPDKVIRGQVSRE